MAHSHDRTMLANLGFADPDKGDPRHDLACQYLVTPDAGRRMAAAVLSDRLSKTKRPFSWQYGNGPERTGFDTYALDDTFSAVFEVPISKGYSQYKTTVGFLDLVLIADLVVTSAYDESSGGDVKTGKGKWNLIVEVKAANPVRVLDAIRQIKFYREYHEHLRLSGEGVTWVLATIAPLSDDEISALQSASIHHVRLGQKFEEWIIERERKEVEARMNGETSGGLEV